MRNSQRLVLHRLAPRALGRHAAAGARPAHRVLADRRRHRLRARVRARARSASASACSTRRSVSSPTFSTRFRASRSSLLVPFTGLTVTTVEIALVSYTLLVLYRNMVKGCARVPAEVLEAARGMGLTRDTDVRARRAAARAARDHRRASHRDRLHGLDRDRRRLRHPEGLGRPIFIALGAGHLQDRDPRRRALAVGLALFADALLALGQRLLTPWSRGR